MHPELAYVIQTFLMLHIACGVIAFLCAPIALLTTKGGKKHRTSGKVYFWAMVGVSITAMILSFISSFYFLTMVTVFSFYSAFSAYRILYLKGNGMRPKRLDWVAAVITILSSLLLFFMGFLKPEWMQVGVVQIEGYRVSIVSIIFGIIGIRMGARSIQGFIKPSREKMFWLFDHLQGMIASYIAAVTAFSAVNLTHWFGSAWWVWLWPTILVLRQISFSE